MSYVRKNLVWLLISQTATWVVSFILLIVTPRLLDQHEFGALAFATTYIQYFALVAGLETAQLLTREVARDHSLVGIYTRNALAMKVVVVIGLSTVAVGAALIFDFAPLTTHLIVVGCVGMSFAVLNSVLQGALAGMQRMARPAMWMVVQLYVGAALGMVILLLGGGGVAFAAAIAGATVIPLIANLVTIRPYIAGSWRPQRTVWRKLVGGGLPLLALTGLTLFYGSIDITMLTAMAGETAVAWYALAYRWAGIPIFVCTAVVAAYFPVFSEHGRTGGPEFAKAVNRALLLVLVVSAPAAFGLASIADDVILTLAGDDYSESIPVLRILVLQVPIAAVDTILGTALVASDRVRPYLVVAGSAAVLTPIALFLSLSGRSPASATIAAALVTTGTEIFVFIGAYRLRAPGVLDRATVSRCLRAVLAAGTISLALWPLGGIPFPVRIPIAAVVFAVAAVALKVVSVREVLRLRETLTTVLRPSSGDRAITEVPE